MQAAKTEPTTPLTDKRFKWVPSAATDVAKTWERARKQMAAQQKAALAEQLPSILKIPTLAQARLKRSNG